MALQTLADVLQAAGSLGRREAIRFDNGFRVWTYTYPQFLERVQSVAAYLEKLGATQGDRALIWAGNGFEWLVFFWSCIERGMVVVPVDHQVSPELLERIVRVAKPRFLFADEQLSIPLAEPVAVLTRRQITSAPSCTPKSRVELSPDDVAEIVFSSGTTGEPRGVIHRHRNICANLRPFAEEFRRYSLLIRPFQPLRILCLLPLSHMFGQALGALIPIVLGGAAVFTDQLAPESIIRCVRKNRVSVLATVPRMLLNLAGEVQRACRTGPVAPFSGGWWGALKRWWRYRGVHRRLGFKFWAVVVGGASLEESLEAYWGGLGFVVVQGYGLTESSPVVAVNHPLKPRRGSLGKAVAGQTVRLAEDGEILVRGESVAHELLDAEGPSELPLEDGWLHTGDIGDIDKEGNIYFRGRKKDVVVLASGLNVFPEDVETVLKQNSEVREAVVVGVPGRRGEVVHAVLVIREGADSRKIVETANQGLEEFQQIRGWSVWNEQEIPRTPSTLKVRRNEVRRRIVEGPAGGEEPSTGSSWDGLLTEIGGRPGTSSDRLTEDLGLSSLDRVELLSRVEEQFGVSLGEGQFAQMQTLGELQRTVEEIRSRSAGPSLRGLVSKKWTLPRWNLWWPVQVLRSLVRRVIVLPLFRQWIEFQVEGQEVFDLVGPPVLFVGNHSSHLDTVALLAAMPPDWRPRLAPAMALEYFIAWFRPAGYGIVERAKAGLQYLLACTFFNAFPLPQVLGGVREVLRHSGELVEKGYCILVFPEGTRSQTGEILTFRPGAALMAARLRLPVVPFAIRGTRAILPPGSRWPQSSARVVVSFGDPVVVAEDEPPEEAIRKIEQGVRNLFRSQSMNREARV